MRASVAVGAGEQARRHWVGQEGRRRPAGDSPRLTLLEIMSLGVSEQRCALQVKQMFGMRATTVSIIRKARSGATSISWKARVCAGLDRSVRTTSLVASAGRSARSWMFLDAAV